MSEPHSEQFSEPHSEQLSARPLAEPHPSRLAPGHPRRREILAAHEAAMSRGEPGYADPDTGLYVLTAAFLTSRSTCCQSGCRHCPYLR